MDARQGRFVDGGIALVLAVAGTAIAEEVPGFTSVAWFGLLAPAGTPDAVVAKLQQAVGFAVGKPEIQKMFADRNVEAKASTPEEFERRIRDEMQQWSEVVKRENIKLD